MRYSDVFHVTGSVCAAKLFGPTCDAQSACATGARRIIELLEQGVRTQQQQQQHAAPRAPPSACPLAWTPRLGVREHVFYEIMAVLNHEDMLYNHQCYALASLTLQEAVRAACSHAQSDEILVTLSRLQRELAPACAPPSKRVTDTLELLIPKHLGDGPRYLAILSKRKPAKRGVENC